MGLIGLQIFVVFKSLTGTLLAGAIVLSLLILPIIIVATREALKAVPKSIKEASYGLGATKWQTIWNQVLPIASANIITGVILALARCHWRNSAFNCDWCLSLYFKSAVFADGKIYGSTNPDL